MLSVENKITHPQEASCTLNFNTVDSPQIGQVLKVTAFCGDGHAVERGPDIGQDLKATGLSGSGGCPI
jgi:hypothetical protein